MTKDQLPVDETTQRAPYERPVVIELNLTGATDGKFVLLTTEFSPTFGPS